MFNVAIISIMAKPFISIWWSTSATWKKATKFNKVPCLVKEIVNVQKYICNWILALDFWVSTC